MNKAILMGRLTRDPEIRTTQSGISVCNFTVACDRRTRGDDGTWQNTADFIPCVAWRGQAEFVNRYFSKGDRILVSGRIQPRSWEDAETGQRRYMTEVVTDEIEFCETRRSSQDRRDNEPRQARRANTTVVDQGGDDFMEAADEDDTMLPFDF
ncbi:MAG: single-stranded DNA-binding protein [Saccharofermentanales bacterium]|jgi:single-strand DNA-binding protein